MSSSGGAEASACAISRREVAEIGRPAKAALTVAALRRAALARSTEFHPRLLISSRRRTRSTKTLIGSWHTDTRRRPHAPPRVSGSLASSLSPYRRYDPSSPAQLGGRRFETLLPQDCNGDRAVSATFLRLSSLVGDSMGTRHGAVAGLQMGVHTMRVIL
jgi:hypothetical protein